MVEYRHFIRGVTPEGALVIRFYRSGGEIRAFLREVAEEGETDTLFPTEELEPEIAFRLAGNRLAEGPDAPVFIELTDGVTWNSDWGRLSA
ncbi:hypothetical protein [Rhizobium sp. TRM95796]|uniref:hypothetical protein n=1 Tax=Rhizobium sp. TRM95796 TaxID=2979862 RepID=UPI0021E781D9|nr:hypothetical protein [Rhizobium sp. TRM95796]MCV3767598.1 hypothetical protein [Rhizobium sp. TRM95796]